MSRASSGLSPEERRLWLHHVRDVRVRDAAASQRCSGQDSLRRDYAGQGALLPLSPAVPPPSPAAAPSPSPVPLVPGVAGGLDRASADRLRRGVMAIEARLDLHGLTQEQAHAALAKFLLSHHACGRRCVLVITGKGRGGANGILRDLLPRWLNEPPNHGRVVACMPATARHGGGGAFYILLRRQR